MNLLLKLNLMDCTQTVVCDRIIMTCSQAHKPTTGPNLMKLFIGAEGSLGIIDEGVLWE